MSVPAPVPQRVRCHVSGRVQGVAFRKSTEVEARRLEVAGWVRNLPDGRVEFVAEGTPEGVQALLAWARRGPALAEVTQLDVQPEPVQGEIPPFRVLRP